MKAAQKSETPLAGGAIAEQSTDGAIVHELRVGGKWQSLVEPAHAERFRTEIRVAFSRAIGLGHLMVELAMKRRADTGARIPVWRLDPIYREALPIQKGDPGSLYLRGLRLGDFAPACLRLHPGLPYTKRRREPGTLPVLIAPLVSTDGERVALLRTYLTPDGRLAPVRNARAVTNATESLLGSFVPLDVPCRGMLGVAIGVEAALAAREVTGVPVVAVASPDHLSMWAVPPLVRHLVVFAEPDMVSRLAASTLRLAAACAGVTCEVLTPKESRSGSVTAWLDVLNRGARVWVEGIAS